MVVVARPPVTKLCQQCLRRATLLALKDSARPREPWLPSVVGERFEFHASTCDGVISPTSAAHSDQRRCLLHTEASE